jgi:hypothetical protein
LIREKRQFEAPIPWQDEDAREMELDPEMPPPEVIAKLCDIIVQALPITKKLKRKFGQFEKGIIAESLSDSQGRLLGDALAILRKDSGQGSNNGECNFHVDEYTFDLDLLSDEASQKFHALVVSAFGTFTRKPLGKKRKNVNEANTIVKRRKQKGQTDKPQAETKEVKSIVPKFRLKADELLFGAFVDIITDPFDRDVDDTGELEYISLRSPKTLQKLYDIALEGSQSVEKDREEDGTHGALPSDHGDAPSSPSESEQKSWVSLNERNRLQQHLELRVQELNKDAKLVFEAAEDGIDEDAGQKFNVAKWEPFIYFHGQRPSARVWMVNTACDAQLIEGRKRRVWAEPGDTTLTELCSSLGMAVPDGDTSDNSQGFEKGQALADKRIATLTTLGKKSRHRYVYRVVHDGMPFDGLKARGYGTALADPLMFQIFVQKHLEWHVRIWKGPFLSVGTTIGKVLLIAAVFWVDECQGIKIHKIDTRSDAWNHKRQPMFRLENLVEAFKLPNKGERYEEECLVMNCIPEGSIVETMEWDEIWQRYRRTLNSYAETVRQKRKYKKPKSKFEKAHEEWLKSRFGVRTTRFQPYDLRVRA